MTSKGKSERKAKPHSSHAMTRWTGAVRAPSGEPRFYSCRICRRCGKEEIVHPAGHFLHGLESKCEMTPKRKPALPRAVRELLRDVVLWHRTTDDDLVPSSEDMALRAERILGVPWDRIVARARKVSK